MRREPLTINEELQTPYYHYDCDVLQHTIEALKNASSKYNYDIHYALKANAHPKILDQIFSAGLGADCVSGHEVQRALDMGVSPSKIVLAGVGKTDAEIKLALVNKIHSINVESVMELKVIEELAGKENLTAKIALRLNPNVDAQTHKHITTGVKGNKFGIDMDDLPNVFDVLRNAEHLKLEGLHFHIGSQIMELQPYIHLCKRANELCEMFLLEGFELQYLNLGGGLGVNYLNPDIEPIPNFDLFFKTIHTHLEVNLPVHFELGRSIVAQCGTLITRVLYEKTSSDLNYLILDAGMTELMRPALYGAHHRIDAYKQNDITQEVYSIAGPICESTDLFGESVNLPKTKRGDYLLIRSAGAYGECMANSYNLRKLNPSVFHATNVDVKLTKQK